MTEVHWRWGAVAGGWLDIFQRDKNQICRIRIYCISLYGVISVWLWQELEDRCLYCFCEGWLVAVMICKRVGSVRYLLIKDEAPTWDGWRPSLSKTWGLFKNVLKWSTKGMSWFRQYCFSQMCHQNGERGWVQKWQPASRCPAGCRRAAYVFPWGISTAVPPGEWVCWT